MATTAIMPVEEYLKLTDKPYREYRHGEVTPKSMPTKLHSLIQKILMQLLEEQGATAYPELTVRLSGDHYLIPDVVVAVEFDGPYPPEPVLLCCEILSPDDRIGSTLAKCEEYHAWGVPYCWVIDPVRRTAWSYPKGGVPESVEILHAGDLVISLAELFARLPR